MDWLDHNAFASHDAEVKARVKGKCATYIRQALEAGGINTNPHPVPAHEYVSYLPTWGFKKVNTTDFVRGDIAVFQGPPGSYADPKTGIPYGHIQMYDGTKWISDFKEKGFWPGTGYQDANVSYQIFRWPGQ